MDLKTFYSSLRAVYGPRDSGTIPLFSADGLKQLLDKKDLLNRWADHFKNVPNQPPEFDDSVLDEIPRRDTATHLPTMKKLPKQYPRYPSKIVLVCRLRFASMNVKI